ncbi:four-carbon acid sugar kinase family protein [Spirillospora sp. CA-142024]|uniref:four-carbon acid sugar kinase family protein n=1 Tax=Spirillospora sp. CA-142024 TaxID=3240036 RepID=UPI003D9502EC
MPEIAHAVPATPHTPTSAAPVPPDRVLGGLPPVRPVTVGEVAARIADGPRLVVLDDDPTGTQAVAGVPVLTGWTVDDLRWGLRQDAAALFVLTNTRSLGPADTAARNRDVVRALHKAARAERVGYVVASRGDSTLRGHFPLETDVLAEELAAVGTGPVDGVVVAPAFIEAGRLTVDSVHWLHTAGGLTPVGHSEFARDATFGYRSSDLREWVAEKTGGRVPADAVLPITLTDLRVGGPPHVAALLGGLRDGRPAVVDAVCDDDLRVLALALAEAHERGKRLLYRVGPSFVRARTGQTARAPLTPAEIPRSPGGTAPHGLVTVGSHVGLTTRQLARVRARGGSGFAPAEFELDVHTLLDPRRRERHIAETAAACAAALDRADVVVRTSRTVVAGDDADTSLAIARQVSAALVQTVRAVTAVRRPRFVLAKGGITSSDIATGALDVRRAWVRGTLLPGIVSLWDPDSGPCMGVPYVVFPGNVGGDEALADVLDLLRGSALSEHAVTARPTTPKEA